MKTTLTEFDISSGVSAGLSTLHALEAFVNGFTLKTLQMISVHTALEALWIYVLGKLVQANHVIIAWPSFSDEKRRFQNVFRPRGNKKLAFSNFPGLEGFFKSIAFVTD